MKFFYIPVLLVALSFVGCSEKIVSTSEPSTESSNLKKYPEPVRDGNYVIDKVTGTRFLLNPNLTSTIEEGSAKLSKTNIDDTPVGEWTDATGRVNIKIYQAHVQSTFYSQPNGHNRAEAAIYIENDRVLIGGGAYTTFEVGQPEASGAYIIKSYPLGSDLTCWAAQSKDHYYPNSPHTLYVYAIGLKVKNENGTWMSRSALKNYINLYTQQSASGTYISTSVQPDVSYETVGGGVSINWGDQNWHVNGNQLLFESHRESNNSWYVSSGSHTSLQTNTITAFAIGIYRYLIPGFGTFRFMHSISTPSDAPANSMTTNTETTDPSWVPSCIGVKSGGTDRGRHVYKMKYGYAPNMRPICEVGDKDLLYPQAGSLYTYVTQLSMNPL